MQEFIIWGVSPKHGSEEQILVSENARINSYESAKLICKHLESQYHCTNTRIQVINQNEKPDFTKTINI